MGNFLTLHIQYNIMKVYFSLCWENRFKKKLKIKTKRLINHVPTTWMHIEDLTYRRH